MIDFLTEYYALLWLKEQQVNRELTESEESLIFINLLRYSLGLDPLEDKRGRVRMEDESKDRSNKCRAKTKNSMSAPAT